MFTQIDTTISNREPSEKLKGMLVDIVNNTGSVIDSMEEYRDQAYLEGFNKFEADLLLKTYLERGLGKAKARWILYHKPRKVAQKSLTDKPVADNKNDHNKVPEIPAPDYNIVIPDQVIDEVIQEQKREPDYAIEKLRTQLHNANNRIRELTAQSKTNEEKCRQLEAKTRVSLSIPAEQGNIVRTKIVVSDIFREVLKLKGSKVIYANVVIDKSQNKYMRLEPL